LPCAPPRIWVSDEAPCASTGPASTADIAKAIAEVINFIHYLPSLIRDEGHGDSMHRPPVPDLPIAQTKRVTSGAFTMQTASCGYRLGISGQFCETLASGRPYMRQSKNRGTTPLHENSAKQTF
jgi:hypothetical protein